MARGRIKSINMPENHGKIDRTDDGSNDDYQFQIPQGLADPDYHPEEGHTVDFELDPETSRKARNVTKVEDDSTDVPGDPATDTPGDDPADPAPGGDPAAPADNPM